MEIPSTKELSCEHYNRKNFRLEVSNKALLSALPKRRPATCFTDPNHHTGNTVKHPYKSCSRKNCVGCHISDKEKDKSRRSVLPLTDDCVVYTMESHRQKKHASALLKSQRRVKKCPKDKQITKQITKQYRNQERQAKNDMSEPRQYYCNHCKDWNNTGKCDCCYVGWWCGVYGDYHMCRCGILDLCPYHVDNWIICNDEY